MQTTVVSLKDQTNTIILNVDEDFWSLVYFVAFFTQLVEIRMKNGTTHQFLHYWAYEVVRKNDHTEEQRQEIYRMEKCRYRFSEDSESFTNWLYDEAEKRDLLLFE